MAELLAGNPLLTLFLVIALGATGARSSPSDNESIQPGDLVSLFATKSVLPEVTRMLGKQQPLRAWVNSQIQLRRYTMSNSDIAGKPPGQIPVYDNYRARVTRVRRVAVERALP